MDSSKGAAFEISREELNEFNDPINLLFKEVAWRSEISGRLSKTKDNTSRVYQLMSDGIEVKLSIIKKAMDLSNMGFILQNDINNTLSIVRDGLRLGNKVYKLYETASGLDRLQQSRALSSSDKIEFREKTATAAAIGIYVTASYVVYMLSSYKQEDLSGINLEFGGIPELPLSHYMKSRNCMTFYYGGYLIESGSVNTGLEFAKMTLLYFQGILDEIKAKESSFKYVEFFNDRVYKLKDSEFAVDGFNFDLNNTVTTVEFNRVEWDEIVGNVESKHAAKRLIQGLLCYDPETKKNPMKDLGGFKKIDMSYGPPGTGKSMDIAATATELKDRCDELGIPFLFWPFPDNVISTFQGGSSDKALSWFKPIQDTSKIIFAPIDDAENNLERRTNQGVSSGVQEVVGVFLRMTEGAYAIDYGNASIRLYTNIPEKLDDAVLSRIQGRSFMGGAERYEDFLDQDYIGLISNIEDLVPGFIDLLPPSYEYMSKQLIESQIEKAYKSRLEISSDKLKDIFESVKNKYDVKSHEFFGRLDVAVKKEFPGYTSRDKRNIQSAVKTRMMDFDFPEEWMNNPEIFYRKSYDIKRKMIIDQMRQALGGKSFADILLEESLYYFDNMINIGDSSFEQKVQDRINEMKVMATAQRRQQ